MNSTKTKKKFLVWRNAGQSDVGFYFSAIEEEDVVEMFPYFTVISNIERFESWNIPTYDTDLPPPIAIIPVICNAQGKSSFYCEFTSQGTTVRCFVYAISSEELKRKFKNLSVMNGAWGLQFGLEIPEVIIIGIGYDVEDISEVVNLRNRDLLPTNDPEFDAQSDMPDGLSSGDAEAFLAFINEEVKPAMNARYRINTDSQSLVGYSFGGVFSLFTLFTNPDAFDNYVIGSPSIWWHDTVTFGYETRYADAHDDLPKNVYLSSGAMEEAPDGDDFMMVSNARKMAELLQSRNYPNLKVSYKNFADDTHATSYLPSAIQGLRFVLGN